MTRLQLISVRPGQPRPASWRGPTAPQHCWGARWGAEDQPLPPPREASSAAEAREREAVTVGRAFVAEKEKKSIIISINAQ